jgi:L-aminopeptidase/D-esterase-like protein
VAGIDVRGHATGTRETDLLQPVARVEEIHGLCLSGGSAFGLAAASGVARWLADSGYGLTTLFSRVPIVPAAVIYDLSFKPVPDPARRTYGL